MGTESVRNTGISTVINNIKKWLDGLSQEEAVRHSTGVPLNVNSNFNI